MTRMFAMVLFMTAASMFSIGLYRYLMQFDAAIPAPYPPLAIVSVASPTAPRTSDPNKPMVSDDDDCFAFVDLYKE